MCNSAVSSIECRQLITDEPGVTQKVRVGAVHTEN